MNASLNYTTFVCAGSVIVVADEVSESDRQDGLDALLYAQTLASHKYPEFAESESWIHTNKVAIRTMGGLLMSDPQISLPVPQPGGFTLSELMRRVLSLWVPGVAMGALDAALTLLSDSASASKVLREHALQQERRVQLQLGVMSPGIDLIVAAISFEYEEAIAGSLSAYRFSHEKVTGNLSIGAYKALIDPEDYDLSRATVISLLGARRQEKILQLR